MSCHFQYQCVAQQHKGIYHDKIYVEAEAMLEVIADDGTQVALRPHQSELALALKEMGRYEREIDETRNDRTPCRTADAHAENTDEKDIEHHIGRTARSHGSGG